jgi:hypothetical protein
MARKKITVTTDNSEWKAPKKRKPRKPMSDKQKAAVSERLVKAREAKLKKNPDYGQSNIHESLRNLPDDHPLSPSKVKNWIKVQKEYVSSERAAVRHNIKGAIARLANHEGYVRNMQSYFRTGAWIDMFYGEHQQNRIHNKCIALAYYWYGRQKGQPKRDIGTFYPDMGCTYTQEMFEEENGYERPRDTSTGKRNKRTVGSKGRQKSKAS